MSKSKTRCRIAPFLLAQSLRAQDANRQVSFPPLSPPLTSVRASAIIPVGADEVTDSLEKLVAGPGTPGQTDMAIALSNLT